MTIGRESAPSRHRLFVLRAWTVHLYTALGLVAGLFAVSAIMAGHPKMAFLWLGVAFLIDGTDGVLARAWQVGAWTPQFDGRKLDDIVDYLNYTFIPVVFAYRFDLVSGAGIVALFFVLIASVYGFCQKAAKTEDGFFTGFPSYWNVLIFYLYLFGWPPVVNALILSFFAVMVWVPIKYVSSRTEFLYSLSMSLSGVYGLILLAIVLRLDQLDMRWVWLSLFFPLYYVVLSFYLTFRRNTV